MTAFDPKRHSIVGPVRARVVYLTGHHQFCSSSRPASLNALNGSGVGLPCLRASSKTSRGVQLTDLGEDRLGRCQDLFVDVPRYWSFAQRLRRCA